MNIKFQKENKMSNLDLQEFKADHEGGEKVKGGEIADAVTGAGGAVKKRKADASKAGYPVDDIEDITPGNKVVHEDVDFASSIDSLFEGLDISEDFKGKVATVFESAVNEAVEARVAELTEDLAESLSVKLEEEVEDSVSASIEEIIENLDSYLDYVVSEWVSENELAIESGIKVEMAESLMSNLKTMFEDHNIDVTEETIDIVSELEEELAQAKSVSNRMIDEAIELKEEVKLLKAARIFSEMTEGLSDVQAERFRVLSEKLNYSNLETFEENLVTIKESFFKTKAPVIQEQVEQEEMLNEDTNARPTARYRDDSVNAIASAITRFKK